MHKRISTSRRVFVVCNYLFLTLLSLAFFLPMMSIISTSFVSQAELQERGSLILIPHSFDLSAYKILLNKDSVVWGAYGNTFFRVIVGTALQMAITCMLAYTMSKKDLPYRKTLTMYILIPKALEESAMLDGAQPLRILVSIILPLSLPSIMTIGMFYAVDHWNAWFDAAIYINTNTKLPMQNIMRNLVQQFSASDLTNMSDEALLLGTMPQQTIQNASVVVATLPILVVYPFVQKYFIKGIMVGSLKG